MAKVSARGGFHLLWGLVISTVISSVGTIVIGNLLSADDMGIYYIALAGPTLIQNFRDWGVGAAMIKYSAQYNSQRKIGEVKSIILSGLVFQVILGLILNRTIKGESPEIFVEIPPYRLPYAKALLKKLWMRTRWFLKEAVPYVLAGVLIVNILYSLGIIAFVGRYTEPLITGLMGLPAEAVGAMIVGFLRKDVAVGMLVPLGLSMKQMVIASVVLTMYFPCIATFTVMIKELDIRDMIKATIIMMVSTITVGTSINLFF